MICCDFVQAPASGNPNHGACLSSTEEDTAKEAITTAAEQASQYAKPGRIYGIVYIGMKTLAEYTGDNIAEVRDKLIWLDED